MESTVLLKKLKNLRKKWRGEVTREFNFRSGKTLGYVPNSLSIEKSSGIAIGYGFAASQLDKLIRELETGA